MVNTIVVWQKSKLTLSVDIKEDRIYYKRYIKKFMGITDSQIFIALFTALITGVLAVRLGLELYK